MLKQLEKNVAIFMENQDLQQYLTETNSRALNINKTHLGKNRHMINRLTDALKTSVTQYTIINIWSKY